MANTRGPVAAALAIAIACGVDAQPADRSTASPIAGDPPSLVRFAPDHRAALETATKTGRPILVCFSVRRFADPRSDGH